MLPTRLHATIRFNARRGCLLFLFTRPHLHPFHPDEDLTLSEEEQKGLGVTGKTIPAGTYPVLYKARGNTFIAIAAVW